MEKNSRQAELAASGVVSPSLLARTPVGHNMLSRTVSRLFQEARVTGHFTNHSLRATAGLMLAWMNSLSCIVLDIAVQLASVATKGSLTA